MWNEFFVRNRVSFNGMFLNFIFWDIVEGKLVVFFKLDEIVKNNGVWSNVLIGYMGVMNLDFFLWRVLL